MKTGTKEHYEIMNDFERDFAGIGLTKSRKASGLKNPFTVTGRSIGFFRLIGSGILTANQQSNT